jgi:membrane protein
VSESSIRPYAVKPLSARLQASRPWRAWKRYNDVRGNILAAGVSYFAFFSIFPAVALAFTVFGFVLREHPELLASVTDNLNANLPGFVKDAQNPDGLIPIQAPRATALTITGVIAFVTLVLAGMGWLGAVREGIRAVFGVQGPLGSMVTTKLRDLGVLCTLGLGILVVAVLTTGVGAAAGWIAERIGMSGHGGIVQFAGFTVSVLADTALMMVLMRMLSGVPVPWRDLSQGALVGGVGFSLLKLSAATVLPRLTANPLFASIAIVVGLLIWLNLIARLTLISAAWAANDVDEMHGHEPRPLTDGPAAAATPGSAAAMRGSAVARGSTDSRGGSLPTFGTRSGDRTTLAAGAVLGATAAVAAGVLARGIRSAVGLVRR